MARQTAKFKKAVSKAKRLYKSGRYKTFGDAVKAAYKKLPGKKSRKVGATRSRNKNRQTGTSSKRYDKMRSARPPGRRIPAGGTKVTYIERRKNRSDVPGRLTGVTAASLRSELVHREKDTLSKQLLRREMATRKTDRRKVSKLITETKRRIRKLQS